ncbi:MAG: hypothetical protein RLZZ521_1986 [Pseudomonadota bacterium]
MNNGLVIHRFVEISKLSMLTRHQKTYLATGLQMLQVIEKKEENTVLHRSVLCLLLLLI